MQINKQKNNFFYKKTIINSVFFILAFSCPNTELNGMISQSKETEKRLTHDLAKNKAIKAIKNHAFYIELKNKMATNPVHYLSMIGDIETLKLILKEDASLIRSTDNCGAQPIHYACINDQVETLNFLLEIDKTLINAADIYGAQPLHYACGYGTPNVLKALLDKDKSIVNSVDIFGRKPDEYNIIQTILKPLLALYPDHRNTSHKEIEAADGLMSLTGNKRPMEKETKRSFKKASKRPKAD